MTAISPERIFMHDDESSPWRTLAVRRVYDNPWITVEEDEVVNPAGGPGIYGRVLFKNLAVGVLPVDDEAHTWLVGQYRYPLGRYSWEIPMGGSPLGVDPAETALRELKEETGLMAERLERLVEVDLSNSITDERGVVYLAESLTAGEPEPEETERLAIRRLPLEEAVAMALDGRITDALSVLGLLAVERRRR
jgi:8-oxo-dGTP pyrophosphatase MutT (NUDIX family)